MNKTLLLALLLIQILVNAQFSERNLSSEKWQFKNSKENKWLMASVPGTVHLDLMNNKLIPDPYKDENEKKVYLAEVKINDVLRVKPGEKIPVDGKIKLEDFAKEFASKF